MGTEWQPAALQKNESLAQPEQSSIKTGRTNELDLKHVTGIDSELLVSGGALRGKAGHGTTGIESPPDEDCCTVSCTGLCHEYFLRSVGLCTLAGALELIACLGSGRETISSTVGLEIIGTGCKCEGGEVSE